MIKLKLILWFLGRLLSKASKTNTDLQAYLGNKELVFQLQTVSGAGRRFCVKGQRVTSAAGLASAPTFAVVFKDAKVACDILTSKDRNAFLRGIQDKDVQLEGNMQEVMWFQGMMKYLRPRKPKT